MKCTMCSMPGEYQLTTGNETKFYCHHHSPNGAAKVSSQVKVTITKKSIKPLLAVMFGILLVSLLRQVSSHFDPMSWMTDLMGVFLVTFGLFKLYDLKGFVGGFTTYDYIAKKIRLYAYSYPFIEIILGSLYLAGYMFTWQNVTVLLLSLLGMASAYAVLKKKEEIVCVCLGTAFNLPMTWVTFAENTFMGTMVVVMLLW